MKKIETNYFELKKLQLNHCNLKDCPICWNAVGVWVPVDCDKDNEDLVKEIHKLIDSIEEKADNLERKVVSRKDLNEFLQNKLKRATVCEEIPSKKPKTSEEQD